MSLQNNFKKIIYFTAAFLLLTALCLFAFLNEMRFAAQTEEITHSRQMAQTAKTLMTSVNEITSGFQGFLLTRKEIYLEAYFKNKDSFKPNLAELKKLFLANKGSEKSFSELQDATEKLNKSYTQVLEQKQLLLYQSPLLNKLLDQIYQLTEKVKSNCARIIQEEENKVDQKEKSQNRWLLLNRIMLLIWLILWIAFGLSIYLAMFRPFEKKLNALTDELQLKHEELSKATLEIEQNNEQLSRANEKITRQNEVIKEQSEEKFKQILETLNEIVWSFEFSSVQNIFINKGIEKITGKNNSLIQTNYQIMLDITHPEDIHLRMNCNTELLEKGYTECTYRVIASNGDIRWFFDKILLRKDPKGKPLRVDGITTDISKFKQIEEEKNKLIQQLLHQNNDLREFSFIVSHNMRAPIARIIGLTSIIDPKTITHPESKEMIEHIRDTAKKLDEIVVDLNQVLSNKNLIEEPYEEVEFSEVLFQVEQILSEQIQKNKVTFLTDFSKADRLYSIHSYLFSILYNLISNAIKFRAEEREPMIQIKTERTQDYVLLTIRDNGLGIDLDKHKQRLFALFQRIHVNVEGKGIGLFLVKSQVEALEGKIEVESEPDKGSAFYIYLKKMSKKVSKALDASKMADEEVE